MKQFFLLLLLVGITYSCTNEADRIPASNVQAAAPVSDLNLDAGRKWRADEATSAGINDMQQTVQVFATGNNVGSIQAYQELGRTLKAEINTIFRQCTMTGPAHDELHKFLVPVVHDIDILQGEDLAASTAAQLRLEERLLQYQTFFE